MDGGDDHFVGIVVRQQAAHQAGGVGVFLHTAFLKAVELFAGLAVQVFAVHHEKAFFNIGVVLEQGGRLEGGKRFAAARGVPDVAVATVLLDAVHDLLDRIDLVGPHHQELLFTGHEHHVAADCLTQGAFGKKSFGKAVEVGDLVVRLVRKLVDGQKALVLIEREVARVVVGEIPGVAAVADDEKLQKAQQRLGVTVAWVVFVVNDLLHGAARVDGERFELHLHAGHAVDQNQHVIAVVAVVSVDAQLVDHLKGVFAPVFDVDQGVVERCAVVTRKCVDAAQVAGACENVGCDDVFQQPFEFAIAQIDAIECLKFLTEVALQSGAVTNVGAVFVFEALQLADKAVFDVFLFDGVSGCDGRRAVSELGSGHVGLLRAGSARGCSNNPPRVASSF